MAAWAYLLVMANAGGSKPQEGVRQMAESKISKPDHHYSGDKSKKFWARINRIPHSEGGGKLYTMGCILQDVEERVIRELKESERRGGRDGREQE